MKKDEILKSYRIDKIDSVTVFIQNKHFNFCYTIADAVVRPSLRGKYRYFGGLQCNFPNGSEEYKNLEKWLCEMAELHLKNQQP